MQYSLLLFKKGYFVSAILFFQHPEHIFHLSLTFFLSSGKAFFLLLEYSHQKMSVKKISNNDSQYDY